MPTCSNLARNCRFFSGVALLAACAAALAPAAYAQSSLDLTLHTGNKAAPKPKISAPASRTVSRTPAKRLASRSSSSRTSLRQEAVKAPAVLGKLGQVLVAEARLRVAQDTTSRALSVVGKGTYLAVVQETGDYYGVLMVDKTVGWVEKSAVQLIDYQVAVEEETTARRPAADLPVGLPAEMDARTEGLLREAFTYLGVRYLWAGNTRTGIDCSGFVKNVFRDTAGISLPRHSGDQAKVGSPVEWDELRAGDRLYFDMGKGKICHTGIYLGNGYFIHASSNQGKVGVDSLMKPNYYRGLVAARRD